MRLLRFLCSSSLALAVVACDKEKPVPGISEKKSSFSKTAFTQPVSGNTITLVSETECEIAGQQGIMLAEYSREGNKFRVVARTGGSPSVTYYDINSDGLVASNSGETFLLPEAIQKFQARVRADEEAEEARRQAERDRLAKLAPIEAESKKPTHDLMSVKDWGGSSGLRRKTIIVRDTEIQGAVTTEWEQTTNWFGRIDKISYVKNYNMAGLELESADDEFIGRRSESGLKRLAYYQFDIVEDRNRLASELDKAIQAWNKKYDMVRKFPYQGLAK